MHKHAEGDAEPQDDGGAGCSKHQDRQAKTDGEGHQDVHDDDAMGEASRRPPLVPADCRRAATVAGAHKSRKRSTHDTSACGNVQPKNKPQGDREAKRREANLPLLMLGESPYAAVRWFVRKAEGGLCCCGVRKVEVWVR